MESGLVLAVPALEPVVDRWRVATVPTAAAGGPAHVTALYPWLEAPVTEPDLSDLSEVLGQCPPVRLTFDRLDRFEKGVLFLALDSDSEQAARRLTQTLMHAYPQCLPYGGEHADPHPHLTVALGTTGELDGIEPDVTKALAGLLPYTVTCEEVVVLEQQPDGRWVQAHRFPLRAAPAE